MQTKSQAVRVFGWDWARDTVISHVWEIWTKNGLGLDEEDREQTIRSARDAVTNTYTDHLSDEEWTKAALKRLGHDDAA